MIRFLMVIFLYSLMSCGSGDIKVLEQDKMVDIMTDLMYAEDIINLYGPAARDSIRILVTQSLLKIHDLDRSELDTNLYLYQTDFKKMEGITKAMLDKYDKAIEKIKENKTAKN